MTEKVNGFIHSLMFSIGNTNEILNICRLCAVVFYDAAPWTQCYSLLVSSKVPQNVRKVRFASFN